MRVETAGLLSPSSLYKGMVSSGIHSQVASELYAHEKAHADADEERSGEFGFYVTGGWIVAYYLIKGERTPEQLMRIASAPGLSQMSQQDWKIYNSAWSNLLNQIREDSFKNQETESLKEKDKDFFDLKQELLDLLACKLDALSESGEFPKLDELLNGNFTEMVSKYGIWIHKAYNEAVKEIKTSYYSQEVGSLV